MQITSEMDLFSLCRIESLYKLAKKKVYPAKK